MVNYEEVKVKLTNNQTKKSTAKRKKDGIELFLTIRKINK